MVWPRKLGLVVDYADHAVADKQRKMEAKEIPFADSGMTISPRLQRNQPTASGIRETARLFDTFRVT